MLRCTQANPIARRLPAPPPVGSDADAVVRRTERDHRYTAETRSCRSPSVRQLGDFGFDSITLKEFAVILSERYGVDISPAVFFAHGSIEALSEHLCTTHPEAVRQVHADPASPKAAESPQVMPEPQADSEAIAIIGMAGRFPGAQNLEEFWRNIVEGRITVSPMPMQRRQLLGLSEDQPSPQAGFIDDIEYFDPGFFRLSKREAVHMDPQHRLALETTWQALHDAGIAPEALAGRPVGVFLGQQVNGYAALLRNAAPEAVAQAALGNVSALMPNRISYILDLHGPSEAIDTACSSALVAVHRAVRALRAGECELAIAGGVSLLLDINDQRSTERLGVLSADGRCHSFDARANGYVKGEGVGIVVLKPLSQALADGNPIHALIRGSAVNHGGRAQSLTAPNPLAQAELIRSALTDAEVEAASIGYIETHGTGTELGDPIEVEALKAIFGDTGDPRCALGSVKVNIGHLEPAAGIAGLIKAVLALRHGVRPLLTDLEQPNPYIKLDGTPLYLPRESVEWSQAASAGPRRAGVSAFGFGGSNAHVILEQAPPVQPTAEPLPEPVFQRVKCWIEAAPVESPPAVTPVEVSKPEPIPPPTPVFQARRLFQKR